MRTSVRVSRFLVAASAIALALAVLPADGAVAAAGPIRVNTTTDGINSDSLCTLREAIRSANLDKAIGGCRAGSGADTILVPAGRYVLSGYADEDGGLGGDLDIWTKMTVRGASSVPTIVDGNDIDRVFQILPGAKVTIDRLVITGGSTISHQGRTVANAGGGISNYGLLTLTSSLVTGNLTGELGEGGGIFSSGMITIRDSWITQNQADAGGGLYSSGSAYVIRTHVEENTAAGFASHPPYIPDPSSNDPTPASGDAGGITSSGYLSVSRSVISGNIGDQEWGHGGIAMVGGSIVDSTVSGNRAVVCGTGGISMVSSHLIRSTVSANENGSCGPGAGGVYAVNSEITNSTISGNRSGEYAVGGIRAEGSTIINSTITLNRAALGDFGYTYVGGLEAGATTIRNTIVAGNVGGDGYPTWTSHPDCAGTVTSGGHNLIGDLAGCTFLQLSSDLVNVDPMLGPLANNGGPTQTHSLRPGSPAIDAWYDGTVGVGASCPKTDQRGVRRPKDGDGDGIAKCDIGALERKR